MAIETQGGIKNILQRSQTNDWIEKAKFKLKTEMNIGSQNEVLDQGQGATFGQFLANSIQKVNNVQEQANHAIEKLAVGDTRNLHDTMIAVEQAEIAFKTMNQIRLKVIEAYKEVMRMQV